MSSVPDDQGSVKSSEEFPGSRIKFLCSYGGKILPKVDGQLRYVGGDTRLLSVHRNIGFAELLHKTEKLFGSDLWLKYQLPNEDLDALISVTCDEDVENLIEEYDRNEARDGGSRLRAFLFPRVEPSRVVASSSDQVGDEARSPKGFSDQKYAETVNGPRAQSKMRFDSPSVAFQVPDFLFGLDSGGHLVSHHPQQQDGDSLSPRRFHNPIDKGSPLLPSLPPLKDPTPMSLQADYARQQSARMETVGRGPALNTSALGPLTSNYHHTWESRKLWDGGAPGDQKDEKRPVELNGEANYAKSQRDSGTESAMVRIPSKDRIVPMYMEGSHADAHLMTDRQGRLQSIMQMERHNRLEDVHTDVPPDVRQEAADPGGFMLHRPPEVQRIPQSTLGVAASEVPWGLPQPSVPGFEMIAERAMESYRNSGDSEDGMHRRVEGQVIVDNASHPHSTIATAEESLEGFNFQDALEAYSGRETMALQQQQNQQRHGEYEVSSPVHAQLEAAQHFHRLGKGHFQQVYWQLRDLQEHHQQQQTSVHEPVRIVHSSSAMQRPIQPVNYHLPSSGSSVHHHHMPPSNVRTMPRSDTVSNSRHASPLYRQAAMAGALRPDPQQLSRGPSPLREHSAGSDSLNSSRYGHRVQIHDSGYLPSSIAQPSSELPVTPGYMSDLAEAHSLYDQNGLPRGPSPLRERAAGNDALSSLRYGHRVAQIHDTGYLPSNIAQQSSGLPLPPMYMSAETHSLYDQNGGRRPRSPSPLRERPSGNDTLNSSRYGHRLPQFHETGYLPSTIVQQSSGLPGAPVYVSDLAEAHSLYDQNGDQLHYSEKGAMGNQEAAIGQVQYSDKVSNHDAALGQIHYSDDNLQSAQYVRMTNNQDAQGVSLPQDAANLHSHQ